MKNLRFAFALVVAAVVLGIHTPCRAQIVIGGAPFTNKSLKGSYAMEANGVFRTAKATRTMVGTGLLTSKGEGNLQVEMMVMDGVEVCSVNLSGSYAVQANGMGTGSLTLSSAAPANGICDEFNGQQFSFAFVLERRHPADKIKLSLGNPAFTLLCDGEEQ